MSSLLLPLAIFSITHFSSPQHLSWVSQWMDYIPENRASGVNKHNEACIKSDTGWQGTDITLKSFDHNHLLIGFPLDLELITVELRMNAKSVETATNLCLCYKDRSKKENRYDHLYTEEREMHFYCSKELSMLCYAPILSFAAGNVAAKTLYENIFNDPTKPVLVSGAPVDKEGLHVVTFEFSIVNKATADQPLRVTAYVVDKGFPESLSAGRPFFMPQFDVKKVKDVKDGLEYNTISVLPMQAMWLRHFDIKWCFKSGHIVTTKIDKEPIISTVEKEQFKALDNFEALSVVKNKTQELFQFSSKGSSSKKSLMLSVFLFIYCFLPL